MADTPKALTAHELAKETGHSPVSVYQALERLEIKPSITVGKTKGYDPIVIETLREHMRKPRAKRG